MANSLLGRLQVALPPATKTSPPSHKGSRFRNRISSTSNPPSHKGWHFGNRTSSTSNPPSLKVDLSKRFVDFGSKSLKLAFSGALALGLLLSDPTCAEAKTGVNKPELLPKELTSVIDVAGFLSAGQERRLIQEIDNLEKDTGYKLRILAQNYPDTPGLAIRDYWKVDDRTIVFVADPTFGNIIHFNVGELVDLEVPRSFWSRVSGKYGNMFYWKEKGEDASVEAAVMAVANCLRDPTNQKSCSEYVIAD